MIKKKNLNQYPFGQSCNSYLASKTVFKMSSLMIKEVLQTLHLTFCQAKDRALNTISHNISYKPLKENTFLWCRKLTLDIPAHLVGHFILFAMLTLAYDTVVCFFKIHALSDFVWYISLFLTIPLNNIVKLFTIKKASR